MILAIAQSYRLSKTTRQKAEGKQRERSLPYQPFYKWWKIIQQIAINVSHQSGPIGDKIK